MILTHEDHTYNKRVAKAASSLVIRLPFFGDLLFGTGVRVVGSNLSTMATDGVRIMCGVNFVLTESVDIVMFGLLHELVHVYFAHPSRRGGRDAKIWNIAADIYVNGLCSELLGNGGRWTVPEQFIQPQSWADGMTVEEIYDSLYRQQQADPGAMDQYLPKPDGTEEISNGSDMVEPPPGDGGEEKDAQGSAEWQESFREDISRAKALAENSPMHKPLPGAVITRMDKIMKASMPWGSLLRGSLADSLGWDDVTYAPPKMKYYPIILPQTRQLKERTLLLGIDVSASVTQELIKIFISNVQSAAARATKTVIVTFDQVVREHYETTRPRDIFSHVKFNSGAHSYTSAMGVFEIADKVKPSAICVLTDGYIDHPEKPYKNTIFVIPEGGNRLPWGRTYTMEHPWR
jgi:predicted metal-dependent peptidase